MEEEGIIDEATDKQHVEPKRVVGGGGGFFLGGGRKTEEAARSSRGGAGGDGLEQQVDRKRGVVMCTYFLGSGGEYSLVLKAGGRPVS